MLFSGFSRLCLSTSVFCFCCRRKHTNRFVCLQQQFIADIVDDKVFGRVAAFVWVIESQKRGNLHLHSLFWLAANCKPTTPAQIDAIVQADLPERENVPSFYIIFFSGSGVVQLDRDAHDAWALQ